MTACLIMAALACVVLLPWREAHAYIDPGTGSYMVQLIIAGVVAAAVSVRVYFHRIRAALRSIFRGKREGEGASDENDE